MIGTAKIELNIFRRRALARSYWQKDREFALIGSRAISALIGVGKGVFLGVGRGHALRDMVCRMHVVSHDEVLEMQRARVA